MRKHGCAPKEGKDTCAVTGGVCAWEKKFPTPQITPAALEAWILWGRSQSQWNVGMNGATGMRYEGVEACGRSAGLSLSARGFELFQVLEGKRLQIWSEERKAAEEAAKRKNK